MTDINTSNDTSNKINDLVPIPQLAQLGITQADLTTCIKVLDAIATLDPKNNKKRKATDTNNDPSNNTNASTGDANDSADSASQQQKATSDGLTQFKHPSLRPFRKSLSACLTLHSLTKYDGKSESQYYADRLAERSLKRQKMAEKAMQKKYVASTNLRKGRVEKLNALKDECQEEEEERGRLLEYLVPDGHVDTDGFTGVKMLEDGTVDGINASPSTQTQAINNDATKETKQLPNLRSCYTCKIRFRTLHHFYDQLCESCAPFNYSKRHQTADMSNKVAIVTGSRVKIGYQVVLKLLRAGCEVVATTRFPNCAVGQYRKEEDFHVWKDRLHLYGLDLRDVTGLEAFTRYLKLKYGKRGIDVLINNACQTVRRPGGYYVPLVEREGELWRNGDEDHKSILGGCLEFERIRRRLVVEHAEDAGRSSKKDDTKLLTGGNVDLLRLGHESAVRKQENGASDIVAKSNQSDSDQTPFESTGITHSAAMSQMTIVPEDMGVDEKVMPSGLSDINGQQLDLRKTNSWLLKMDQVSTPEIMECMFVNAIAPFVLNSRLKPLMETPTDRPDRYIINVSAMEGKFYRYKMPNHPHTNMAKAALNMLTRTSSEDLAKKSRIYMNSVDTGWINDENPLEKASKIAKTNLFQTPIDEIDAAARILDPVFVGVSSDKDNASNGDDPSVKEYGKFFKDYKETEW